ncbi:MAG TPA: type I-U CRISPR-associated RAMP protein Csb1/Cas7u [Bryobacteraceae bacterium]|jgi:CRISPR-associated protein Csb1
MATDMNLWLEQSGPAALILREHLTPVEGPDGVFFPATFAATEDKTFKGGYNIDTFADGTNICLVDSVGSQANRIEPIFMKGEYCALVPRVTINAGRKINLLEAGHRAGDAIVRCSALQQDLQQAFRAAGKGNCEPLAKIAPTSCVFGAWDSRDTQTKLPRLIASTIRAYNVKQLRRSATYVPATEYVKDGLVDDPEGEKKEVQEQYAKRGFVHVPASAAPGGVIAMGGIRRDATLHLAALRTVFAEDEARTLVLRKYILGLAITAFTYLGSGYLRQGCNLVLDADKEREFKAVYPDGRREDIAVTHAQALEFAKAGAAEFVVGPSKEVFFDKERAKRDLSGDGARKPKATAAKK